MNITATNKATGEVVDLPANNLDEIATAWRVAQEYVKTAESLKDQLKRLVPAHVGSQGVSEPVGNYVFRVSHVQRTNYDKAVMRRVLDEDTLDLLLKPNKQAVDKYLKEHLDELGDASTELRSTMIPEGFPYQVIKLEKVARDDHH